MSQGKILLPLVISLTMVSSLGSAQSMTDRMGACLVNSSTGADRIALARWIGLAIVAHPSVSESIAVPNQVIDQSDREIAEVITRLMTVNCLSETRAAEDESISAIEDAFEVFGVVAMQEVMLSPAVESRLIGFTAYINEDDFSVLD